VRPGVPSESGQLREQYGRSFDVAINLAVELTNGTSEDNVHGLCELIGQ
jgi:hypothetical protein